MGKHRAHALGIAGAAAAETAAAMGRALCAPWVGKHASILSSRVAFAFLPASRVMAGLGGPKAAESTSLFGVQGTRHTTYYGGFRMGSCPW